MGSGRSSKGVMGLQWTSAEWNEEDLARQFLLEGVHKAGTEGGRVAELLQGAYAESKDLPWFAKALYGCIAVRPPTNETDVQGTRYFGEGPLRMEVQMHYLQGKSAPHYKL